MKLNGLLTRQKTDEYAHEYANNANNKFTNSNGIPNNRACISTKQNSYDRSIKKINKIE